MRKQPELPTAAPRALNRPRLNAPRPVVGGDNVSHLVQPTSSHSEVVMVGGEQLQVSGSSAELVRTARVVLHEFFNVCGGPQTDPIMGRSSDSVGSQDAAMASPPRSKNNSGESSDTGPVTGTKELLDEEDDDGPELVLTKPELCYEKETLLQLSKSPLCRATPERWSELVADLPGVVRRADRWFFIVLSILVSPFHFVLFPQSRPHVEADPEGNGRD